SDGVVKYTGFLHIELSDGVVKYTDFGVVKYTDNFLKLRFFHRSDVDYTSGFTDEISPFDGFIHSLPLAYLTFNPCHIALILLIFFLDSLAKFFISVY